MRIVRLGVFMATSGDFFDQPRVADGASDLFRDAFGPGGISARLVIGVTSLPLGMPVELADEPPPSPRACPSLLGSVEGHEALCRSWVTPGSWKRETGESDRTDGIPLARTSLRLSAREGFDGPRHADRGSGGTAEVALSGRP